MQSSEILMRQSFLFMFPLRLAIDCCTLHKRKKIGPQCVRVATAFLFALIRE